MGISFERRLLSHQSLPILPVERCRQLVHRCHHSMPAHADRLEPADAQGSEMGH